VALYYVAVQEGVGTHATFYVHFVASFERSEIALLQRLVYGSHGVAILAELHYGEAYAVMGYALVYLELVGDRRKERYVEVTPVFA
jgi:hypothetical protein